MKMDYQMVDQGPGLAGAQEGGGENDTEKEEKEWTFEFWETASFFGQQIFTKSIEPLAASGNIDTGKKK